MANNEILNFANSPTANVESQAAYTADPERTEGNQQGTVARSDFNNKLMLQTSSMCAGAGEYLALSQLVNVTDQLTKTQLAAMWRNSVTETSKYAASIFYMNESLLLDPNDLIMNNPYYTQSPGPYVAGDCVYFKARVANTGPMTVNLNSIGPVSIKVASPYGTGGIALIDTLPYSVQAGGMYFLAFNGTDFVLINPTNKVALVASIALNIPQSVPGTDLPQTIAYDTILKTPSGSATWVDIINSRIQPNIPGQYRISVVQMLRNYTGTGNDYLNCFLTVSTNLGKTARVCQMSSQGDNGDLEDKTLSGSIVFDLNGTTEWVNVQITLASPGESAEATSFYVNGISQSLPSASLTVEYIGG